MSHKTAVFVFIFATLLLFKNAASQELNPPIILITEIAYDTWRDDSLNEWVELLVVSDVPIDGKQIKLGDEEEIGGGEGMVRFPKETVLEPGQVIVVAQSAVDFWAVYGVYPSFEIIDSTDDVPNMINVSLLAKGDIAFANSGDEIIVLDERNKPLDRVSYGDKTTYLNPAIPAVAAGLSLERYPPNCDTDTAGDFRPQNSPTPFSLPEFGVCPVEQARQTEAIVQPTPAAEGAQAEEILFIGDAISGIQGAGSASDKVDQIVTFEGIVTAVTADKNASGTTFYTFFVQDSGDEDLKTSDAIAVFSGRKPPSVSIGDWVEITGTVTEFFGLTEIDDKGIAIKPIRQNQPVFESMMLNAANRPAEHLEGMLVALPEAIVVGPTFDVDSGCGFSVVPVGTELPIIRHSISDDISNIIPILPNDDRDCDELPALKRGDHVFDLVGPLTWNFDQWKIIQNPDVPIRVEVGDPLPLPKKIKLQGNQFSLATLNLENHFDSLDDTGDESEPKLSAEIIAVREQKFGTLIADWMGCPTLIGVQEVEKESLLVSLAKSIEPLCGFEYRVAHRESYDGRGIDNALLFNPNRVELIDYQLRQSCTALSTGIDPQGFSCPAGQEPLFSRPPFETNLLVDGQPLTLFINHFKSKRGGEQETANRREAQAKHITTLVDARLNAGHATIAVIGDFNDYADSVTMQFMTQDRTLENVLRRLPIDEQYSFNFGGAAQLIDGILLTAELAQVTDHVQIIHLNADYPDSYQLDLQSERLSLKSTDHDPAIVIFEQLPKPQELQQVDENSGQTAPNLGDTNKNVAKLESNETSGPSFDLSSSGWLIYLLPVVALLASGLVVLLIGRKS